jgi:hypothetical protein
MGYVLSATKVIDVECGTQYIEVKTDRFQPGLGWNIHTDFLYTQPKGRWTELKFQRWEQVSYEDFLNSMVHKNLDVHRKIARLLADKIYETHEDEKILFRLMGAIKILDPSFEPPVINLKCTWQKELLNTMCTEWTKVVIGSCMNTHRLGKYSKILQIML